MAALGGLRPAGSALLRRRERAQHIREPLPPAQRPMIVAHRGASFDLAEHTLAAYERAITAGAEALECDIRLTKDGHLVCVHDRRVDRTSNGQGIVSAMTLAELQALNFASWKADSDLQVDRDLEGRVLTLERLLELVREAEREVRLLIETKHPTRHAGMVEIELVRTLARFGWAGRPGKGEVPTWMATPVDHEQVHTSPVTVMSFAVTALRRVRVLAPDLPTVLLSELFLPGRRDGSLPAGVPITGPSLAMLQANPSYVSQAHERGNFVYVWTADQPDEIEFLLDQGVDAIISNRPDLALSLRESHLAADRPKSEPQSS